MTTSQIAVLSGTGITGRRIVERLEARGIPTRSRDHAGAAAATGVWSVDR